MDVCVGRRPPRTARGDNILFTAMSAAATAAVATRAVAAAASAVAAMRQRRQNRWRQRRRRLRRRAGSGGRSSGSDGGDYDRGRLLQWTWAGECGLWAWAGVRVARTTESEVGDGGCQLKNHNHAMLDGSRMIENQLKSLRRAKFSPPAAPAAGCLRLRRAVRAAPGKKLR